METLPKKPSRNTAETKQNLSGDRCCRLVHRRVIAQESRQFRSKVGEDRSRPAGLPAVSSRSRAGWRPPVGPRVPCRSCACLQQPLLPAALGIPVAETKLHRGGGSQGLGPTRAARAPWRPEERAAALAHPRSGRGSDVKHSYESGIVLRYWGFR